MSPATLAGYDWMADHFLTWLRSAYPDIADFRALDVSVVREFRVFVSHRTTPAGRPWQPATVQDVHRQLKTFLSWALDEGYSVDPRTERDLGRQRDWSDFIVPAAYLMSSGQSFR